MTSGLVRHALAGHGPVHPASEENGFARVNRANKVRALLHAIDRQQRGLEALVLSEIEQWSLDQWATFAAENDINAPSDRTVESVLNVLRDRARDGAP